MEYLFTYSIASHVESSDKDRVLIKAIMYKRKGKRIRGSRGIKGVTLQAEKKIFMRITQSKEVKEIVAWGLSDRILIITEKQTTFYQFLMNCLTFRNLASSI